MAKINLAVVGGFEYMQTIFIRTLKYISTQYILYSIGMWKIFEKKTLQFTHNPIKAIEVILWIANQNKDKVDLYKIIKTLFFADIYHLNHYGRTICGDGYVAMEHGPVPSQTYDVLKEDKFIWGKIGGDVPFKKDGDIIIPTRSANTDQLSETDIEALENGWSICKELSFSDLRDLTHQIDAYKKAWKNGKQRAAPIDLFDLIENENKHLFDEIINYSENIKI